AAAQLIRDASFIAGLAKVAPDVPKHRPFKILHCISFRQDFEKPTFVVDITDEFEQKMQAIKCFATQFDGAMQAGEVYPTGASLYDTIRQQSAACGALIRCGYGEPFLTIETMRA